MRRLPLIGCVLLALVLLGLLGALAGAQVGGEPTVATQTFTHEDVVTYTIPTETVTTVETVTVTAPTTTTEPPPTTTEEPPPHSQPNVISVGNWTCVGFQDRALVRVTLPAEPEFDSHEAVNLRSDCHGRIDRIEITAFTGHDLLDINSAAIAPHDLTIGGGYVRARGAGGGAHQDCIQFTNGTAARDILIKDVVFSGCDTQHIISSSANVRNVVCDGCTFLPEHDGLEPEHSQVEDWPGCSGFLCEPGPANAMILTLGNGGTLNSLVCIGSRFGHGVRTDGNPGAIGWVDGGSGTWDGQPAPGSGNELALPGDPRCLGAG